MRDEIAHDGDRSWPADGRRDRWRRPLALGVALCVGVAVGGYGVRTWYEDQQRQEVRLHAALFRSAGSADSTFVTLSLRNLDGRPVTIEKTRLHVAGYDTVWSGLDEPSTVLPGEAVDISYEFALDCQRKPPESTTARLRVRPAGGDPRWVDVVVPLHPANSPGNLISAHARLCSDGAVLSRTEVETLDVRRLSDEELVVRVRMTASRYDRSPPPEDLRLTNIDSLPTVNLRVSFGPLAAGDAVALPVVGDLRVRVTRCERLREAYPAELLYLGADLTSDRVTPGRVPVRVDREYAGALLDYLADRCGG